MANIGGGKGPLLGPIGQLFGRGTVASLGEGQILERFATHRDGAAFEALVARHGPTVLGVCRRFLRDPNDVDDAFQATFVILARKAGGLRDREALGPWLHGVACRVAARARIVADRRRRRESPDGRAIERAPAPEAVRPDLRWLLDEEILRLPEKLRLPVVLCLMEGRTYDEAAHQLGWTAGMVRGRLARARSRLQDRLIRRGETPSAVVALVAIAAPAIPTEMVVSASKLTLGVVSGEASASTALVLAELTLRRWSLARAGSAAGALVAASLVVGVGMAAFRPRAEGQGGRPLALARSDEPAPRPRVAGPVRSTAPSPMRRPDGSEVYPITIEGRAVDQQGRGVAGASILVTDANRMRTGDAVLGRALSGPDGRFTLSDLPLPVLPPEPGPIPGPTEGRFEVAGSAPGLAFAWHAVQSYRPIPKPAGFVAGKAGSVAFAGERVAADLVLGPPARVRGRVIDDRGRPVVGARVQVGYIDSTRNPHASGTWRCDAIDPRGGDDLPFNGIGSLPEGRRSARTDADGRYEIDGLPRETKLIALIDQDPTLEPHSLTIATSDSAFPDVRSLGHDGVLDHTFILARKVTVRVTMAASGRAAPGITVLAQGDRMRRAGAIGSTDPEGRATLALVPGSYTLRLEPPIGLACRLAEVPLDVGGRPTGSSVGVALEPASTVVLEAVDADSGRALAGVGFESATDSSPDRLEVQTRAGSVDHPTTDDSGRVVAVMDPGRRRFYPARPPSGYEVVTPTSPILALEPGGTATARFALKKQPQAASRLEEDAVGGRLRATWEAQSRLISRGWMRASRTYLGGGSIPASRLRRLLESLDADRVPPLLELISKSFPEEAPGSTGSLLLASDGSLGRQEAAWGVGPSRGAGNVTAFNGRESVQYNPGNAQVDIGDLGPRSAVRFGVAGLSDFSRWPGWGGRVVERANGRVTLGWKTGDFVSRVVADEATGFVYRETMLSPGTGSGQDHWQFAPRVAGRGAIIPGLSVEHVYRDDKTIVVWIKAIESLDLRSPVPPETFLVAVPPGTQVRDHREGRDDTYRGVARRPITDVVAYADSDPRRFKPFVPPVKVGQPAPAIEPAAWLDRDGGVPAPGLAGRVVLVDFWGIDCGFCVAQMPQVTEAAAHLAGKGLVLIGLHDSSAKAEEVVEFASGRGLTWTLALDRPGDGFGATFAAFGVRSIPAAAVLDRQGRLAYLGDFRGALARAASLLEGK